MHPTNTQSGVALMLSVLVLAAITAITFSLSTIVFIELRASRDVLKSEPALYATLGVTEEALFQYKRFVPPEMMDVTTCSPSRFGVCSLNGVTLYEPPPELLVQEDVPHQTTIYAAETVEVPLFYLQDETCDEQCSWTVPYSEIQLELVPQGVPTDQDLIVKLKSIDQGGSETEQTFYLDEASDRLSIYPDEIVDRHFWLELNNPTAYNMSLAIWTYDHQGDELGVPIILKRVLKIVADYSGLTRTYRVEIPTGNNNTGN